jgi:hypothetical protein
MNWEGSLALAHRASTKFWGKVSILDTHSPIGSGWLNWLVGLVGFIGLLGLVELVEFIEFLGYPLPY